MNEREELIRELYSRLARVPGVNRVYRNPSVTPDIKTLPWICFYEFTDRVTDTSDTGSELIYAREIQIVIEPFIGASSDEEASQVLAEFIGSVRTELYKGEAHPVTGKSGIDYTLSGKATFIKETESSRVLRPADVGTPVAGMGINLSIQYIENINKLQEDV